MTILAGNYFFPHASRFEAAELRVTATGALQAIGAGDAVLDEAPAKKVRASSRLGHLVQRFTFPGGGRFDVADNEAADEFLREARMRRRGVLADRLERSWLTVVVAIGLALMAAYFAVILGIPSLARSLANRTPESVSQEISSQALYLLDSLSFGPTTLSRDDQTKIQAMFDRVARMGARGEYGYHIVFRHGGEAIGPNAFALPDGTVVMTDELWPLIKRNDELEGVFAHEIAHVDRRHTLQMLYRAAMIPAAIAVVTGDVSQVTSLSAALPAILLQAAYARELEQQADDDGAVTMHRLGDDPEALAQFLERLDVRLCGKGQCGPSWLGSHPETHERAERLRHPPH